MNPEISYEEQFREFNALMREARPIFSGKHPNIAGAALAELTAIWLANHISDYPGETDNMRRDLLKK